MENLESYIRKIQQYKTAKDPKELFGLGTPHSAQNAREIAITYTRAIAQGYQKTREDEYIQFTAQLLTILPLMEKKRQTHLERVKSFVHLLKTIEERLDEPVVDKNGNPVD